MWLPDHLKFRVRFACVACVNAPSDGAVLQQKLGSAGREPFLAYFFVTKELRMFSAFLNGC